MKLYFIPKGSDVYLNGVFLAETTKKLEYGDVPQSSDFEPEIEEGTDWHPFIFKFDDIDIYKHPNFLEFEGLTICPNCGIYYDETTVNGCSYCNYGCEKEI